MAALKRLSNIFKYGIGEGSRERKLAAKAAYRKKRFSDGGLWSRDEVLHKRKYGSYDEYVHHQAAKLDKIVQRLRDKESEDHAEFRRRFEGCAALAEVSSVLCLGARLGTEVRALRDLGHFAVGIDLNPGPDNAYVLPGDFHKLDYADVSVDAVYTNALDHTFDVDKLVAEVRRVLRPGGLFLVDLTLGYEEGFVPGEFEATMWNNHKDFVEKLRRSSGFDLARIVKLGQQRRNTWMQAQMIKPAAPLVAAAQAGG